MSENKFFSENSKGKEEIVTNNNYRFWFDTGNFDNWCVHCKKPNGRMWFAYDREYLSWIRRLAKSQGKEKVYNDFIRVFDSACFDYNMKEGYSVIQDVASHYRGDTEKWWAYFWMTMVAEERKENAIIGKRIKRLAVHNLLFDEYTLKHVLKYMRGMPFYEIDELCTQRGF